MSMPDTVRHGAATRNLDLLRSAQLIYVAPAPGCSGVGDYAADFAAEVRPYFRELVEVHVTNTPRETVREVVRNVRAIRSLVEAQRHSGPVIVHLEQSGASLTPFWGALQKRGTLVTATIHDPPQQVWWPFDTKLISGHRLLHHGVHYPIRPLTGALQRRMAKDRTLVALTEMGADESRRRMPAADVRATRIFIPPRQPQPEITERPMAVGFFGYVYKGKGFDKITELRSHLDEDIGIVVAGRGTQAITARPGVTVLGEVSGPQEDDFFRRIRFLVIPYNKNNRYGPVFAASSAVSRSFAYGTPVICNLEGALREIADDGGALGVDGGIAEFAEVLNTAARDEATLRRLSAQVHHLQAHRTVAACAEPLLQAWAQTVAELP